MIANLLSYPRCIHAPITLTQAIESRYIDLCIHIFRTFLLIQSSWPITMLHYHQQWRTKLNRVTSNIQKIPFSIVYVTCHFSICVYRVLYFQWARFSENRENVFSFQCYKHARISNPSFSVRLCVYNK